MTVTVTQDKGERIAKFVSRAGGPSRRETERLILEGKVFVNNTKVTSPVLFVTDNDLINVAGQVIGQKEPARLWSFYKPAGYITTEKDPAGRSTIYDLLPSNMPRLLTVGRLDFNSEGLLLLTNDGALKRVLELPATGLQRHYRVRVFGRAKQSDLDKLARGVVIDRVHYAPAFAEIEKIQGANAWLSITISEGKNREIRKMMQYLGYEVNRLIRTDYGPFGLRKQKVGTVEAIPQFYLKNVLEEFKIKL
ncbi:MAG: pseudouridine synthase [Pseudomonadota bacterium]